MVGPTLEQVLARSLKVPRSRAALTLARQQAAAREAHTKQQQHDSHQQQHHHEQGVGDAAAHDEGGQQHVVPSVFAQDIWPPKGAVQHSFLSATSHGKSHNLTHALNSSDLVGLLRTCSRVDDWEGALGAFSDAVTQDPHFVPHELHMHLVITACARVERLAEMKAMLASFKHATRTVVVEKPATSSSTSSSEEQQGQEQHATSTTTTTTTTVPLLGQGVITQLIDCFARAEQWELALQYLTELAKPRPVEAYTSAISACERGMQWENALLVYSELKAQEAEHGEAPSFSSSTSSSPSTSSPEHQNEAQTEGGEHHSVTSKTNAGAAPLAALVSALEQCEKNDVAARVLEDALPEQKETIMSSYAALIHVWSKRHGTKGVKRF